jgi:hypothetical protein
MNQRNQPAQTDIAWQSPQVEVPLEQKAPEAEFEYGRIIRFLGRVTGSALMAVGFLTVADASSEVAKRAVERTADDSVVDYTKESIKGFRSREGINLLSGAVTAGTGSGIFRASGRRVQKSDNSKS